MTDHYPCKMRVVVKAVLDVTLMTPDLICKQNEAACCNTNRYLDATKSWSSFFYNLETSSEHDNDFEICVYETKQNLF